MDSTTTLFLAEAANGLCLFEDRGSQAEPEALHRVSTVVWQTQLTWLSAAHSFDEFRRRVRLVAFQPFRSLHQALAFQRLLSGGGNEEDAFLALVAFVQRGTKGRSRPCVTTSNVIIQRRDPQTFVLASDEESRELLRGIYQHLDAFIELQRFEAQLAIGDNYPIPHMASKPAEDDQFERLPDEVLLHLFSFLSSEASLAKAELVCRRWRRVVADEQLNRQAWNPDNARRALAFAAAREKTRFVQETNENGIIRMGTLLREQLGALEALGQQLREWYLEHFPELKDMLPAYFGRSEPTSWPNLVLLLGKRKAVTTAWRGGVVQALSEIVRSKKLAGSILSTSVISSGRDISQAEERSMLAHARRIVDTHKEVVGLQDDLATMVQQSAPGLAMLLEPLTVAELLRATGSLVSLAKCTWMTIARLNPAGLITFGDPWVEATSDEDYHQLMRVPEESYLWQFIKRQNGSWASELTAWQMKRVTYLLAKLVGNAAKIDAFGAGSGSAQPELEAYRQRLKERTDILLAGGQLTPTPSDMEVAGLEDDYHSDTDDEVYWGDEDAIDDDDDYNYDGQGEVWNSTPVAMAPASGLPWSVSPAPASSPQGGFSFAGFGRSAGTSPTPRLTPVSVFGAGPVIRRSASSSSNSSSDSSSESDESDDEAENARRSGAGPDVATVWLVINSLVSMELLINEESRRLVAMLRSPGPYQRRILRLVEEFNGHLDPAQLSGALRQLVARAQPGRGLRGGCPPAPASVLAGSSPVEATSGVFVSIETLILNHCCVLDRMRKTACTSLTPRALNSCAGLAPAPAAARWGAERLAQIGNGRLAGRLYSSSKVVDLTTLPQKSSQRIDSVQSVTTADASGLVGAGAPHLRLNWGEDRPKTILMIKKHKNVETTELLDKMATHVLAHYPGTRVLIEPSAGVELPHLPTYHPDDRHALGTVVDLVIAVGGDGTILHVASLFNGEAPPILAFCKGTLGFLTPFRPDEMEGAIERVMTGGFSVTSRMRLSCRLNARGQSYDGKVFQVMNEVAVQGNFVRLTTIDCFVDNHHLGRSTGDGILAATSTGSTAYSYSCGGSAIHPSLQAIVLTPIATRTLPFRPIILPKGPTLKLRLSEYSRDEANVWVDSQRHYRLARGGSVEISASPYPIVTVNRGEEDTHDWLKALKGMNRFVEREYAGPDDEHHHAEAGHHHGHH